MTAEEVSPAYICHMRPMTKFSFKRMWYIASMVRGLTVEEAVKQLTFVHSAGGILAR